ncbi:MAG: hypothetical protein MJ245_04885 [Clostridia bacterium]|nr:hypothetical protein [Clostridia bacterium]
MNEEGALGFQPEGELKKQIIISEQNLFRKVIKKQVLLLGLIGVLLIILSILFFYDTDELLLPLIAELLLFGLSISMYYKYVFEKIQMIENDGAYYVIEAKIIQKGINQIKRDMYYYIVAMDNDGIGHKVRVPEEVYNNVLEGTDIYLIGFYERNALFNQYDVYVPTIMTCE